MRGFLARLFPPTRRTARLLSLAGVLIALAGLTGFWLSRDVARATLSDDTRERLGLAEDDFHVSFVVAGRDITYGNEGALPIYAQDGTIIGWQQINGFSNTDGANTDTILYVDISGDDLTMIAIPRDIMMEDRGYRINSMYDLGGAEGLRRRVEALLDVPIDYYAIIKLDIFQNLVDALGGVEIDVPYRMYHVDNAANLRIDFQPGPQHMDGRDASLFIRFRGTLRGDIDRIDNLKRLAYALLQRAKQLNVRLVTRIPELMDTYLNDIETNASPALIRQLATRLPNLNLKATATLPVDEHPTVRGALQVNARAVNEFMAATFGGVARDFTEAPDVRLLITDRSGTPGLGTWYRDTLVEFGMDPDNVGLRTGATVDPGSTRLFATLGAWQDADYFAELLHADKQQVDRIAAFEGKPVEIELILGSDGAERVTYSRTVVADVQ